MTVFLSTPELLPFFCRQTFYVWLKQGFVKSPEVPAAHRLRLAVNSSGYGMVLGPGMIDGIAAYTIKVHSKFPQTTTPIKGIITLFSQQNGELLAALESPWLTEMRTAVSAAYVTDLMAPAKASRIGLIGAGRHGSRTLLELLLLRDAPTVLLYDVNPSSCEKLRDFLAQHRPLISCKVVRSVQELLEESQIVLMATWSKTPLFQTRHLQPGTHVTSLGCDENGKFEIDPDLVDASFSLFDDCDLARSSGILSHPDLGSCLGSGLGVRLAQGAELRNHDRKFSLYAPVGLPMQDLAIAWTVWSSWKANSPAAPDAFTNWGTEN